MTKMRQIINVMDNGGVQTLNEVSYILELRKNLISLGNLQTNGFSYKFDGDRDIIKVSNGAFTMMRARMTPGNI